jgi:hypothetical protein
LLGIDVLGRRSAKRNFAAFVDSRRDFGCEDLREGSIPTGVVDLAGDNCDELLEGDGCCSFNREGLGFSFSFFIEDKPLDVLDDFPEVLDGVLPILGESETSDVSAVIPDAFRWSLCEEIACEA